MNEVYILSAKRTPIGSLLGSLSSFSAPQLGSFAIKGALDVAGIEPAQIQEVFMGNVLTAGEGQAPARQAALSAGLPNSVPCTTINKVCSSGLKAVTLGTQTIMTGDNELLIAGGMESMSNTPHYVYMRNGIKLGHSNLTDGMIKDGLWDVYNDYHMGNAAELCSSECKIDRNRQDDYAIQSYKRSKTAADKGLFKDEIVPVTFQPRRGDPVLIEEDEEYKNVNFEKLPNLRPVFQKEGTVTAANASTINDGAAALVLASKKVSEKNGWKPMARIVAFADAAQAPEWFTTAPVLAIQKLTEKAGLKLSDIDYFEINEAFSVVSLAVMDQLKLDPEKVNVNGGAVSLGHPIGASGARILVTLLNVLKQNKAKYGIAGLCNGGGGATAVLVENLM